MGCHCPSPSVSLRPTLLWPKENICPMVQCRLTETRVCPEQCSLDQHSSVTNCNSHTFWEHFFKHGFVPTSRRWWLWAGGEEMQEKGWGLRCWQPSDAADNARWGKGSIVLSCWQQNKQQVKLEQGKYSYTKRKSCSSKKMHWVQLIVLTPHDNRFMYLQTGYSLCPFHFYSTRINKLCLLLAQESSFISSKREHKDFLTALSPILHHAPNGQIRWLNFLFFRQENIHCPETIPVE